MCYLIKCKNMCNLRYHDYFGAIVLNLPFYGNGIYFSVEVGIRINHVELGTQVVKTGM